MIKTNSNFENTFLGILPKELLEPIFLSTCSVGALSRCRRVCTDLYKHFSEKKIFERYLAVCTPEQPMVNYWKGLLSSYDQQHPHFSSFFCKILRKADTIDIRYKQINNLLHIISQEKDPVKINLLQHTLRLSLNIGNKLFAPLAFLHYYKAPEAPKNLGQESSTLSSDVACFRDFFKLLIGKKQHTLLQNALSELPHQDKIQIQKIAVDFLNNRIRNYNAYTSPEEEGWCRKLLDTLILLTNDRNIEVASKARSTLEGLISGPKPHQALTLSHKQHVKDYLSTPFFLSFLSRALVTQIILQGICILTFIGHWFDSRTETKLSLGHGVLTSAALTAVILNGMAISEFVALVKNRLEYEIHFNSNSFRKIISLFLVTNLTFLMSYLLLA